MIAKLRGERQGKALQSHARRKLFKGIALVAATGYLAPKAILISEAWACHKGLTHGKKDGSCPP